MGNRCGRWSCPELFISVFTLAALAGGSLKAEPLTLSGDLSSRLSDNVRLAPSNETNDLESRVNLTLAHQTDPGTCESLTTAGVGYGVWRESTFDPEDYASLNFTGACNIGRGLSWQVLDNLRDIVQNSRASETPDNRTRKNVFRTGPVYSLRLSPRDRLNFSANFENTEFSEPEENDSNRYIGTASWNHALNKTLSGGLQFSTNRTELDSGAEIDTDTASILFSKFWQATSISGSIGVSEIESRFGSTEQSSDGVVGDFFIERDINPVTEIYIRGSREFTDQTSDFDIRFGEFVFDLSEFSELEVTALEAGVTRQFSDGTQLDLGVFANRTDYIRTDDVEDTGGVSVGYNKPLSAVMKIQFRGRYQYRTYDLMIDDETYSTDVGLSYQLAQDLAINGRVGHAGRDSDQSTSEYGENWVSLGLSYQFL